MAHRSFLALAFAGVGLIACGSGDVASTGGGVIDQSPTTNPNQPVTSTQHPAPNPNQAAGNPNGPSSSGPGGGGALCTSYCNELLDCLGLRGQAGATDAVAECASECDAALAEVPGCAELYNAFASCIAGGGLICAIVDGELSIDAPNCEAAAEAVDSCADAQPPGPGDDCTSPMCACGGDTCEQCICASGDESACVTAGLCPAAN